MLPYKYQKIVNKVRLGLLGDIWFYVVMLPLQVIGGSLRWLFLSGMANLLGRGYTPCNEMADEVLKKCIDLPKGTNVRLPWIDSSASITESLGNSTRLLAYVAMANGWFGVAVKKTGTKRHYRYYYRRDMTGNWFAEIWSIWKSGFIAAALGIPFIGWAGDTGAGKDVEAYYGLLFLVSGILLVLCFLPRAILGRGTHLAAISLVNGNGFGNYSCAQLINWIFGLGGISYIWLAMGLEWNLGATLGLLVGEVLSLSSEIIGTVTEGRPYRLLSLFVIVPAGIAAGMAGAIIPAAILWYVSLSFWAHRKAKGQLKALPFTQNQADLYEGSNLEYMAGFVAPQISLGGLVYLGGLFGFVLFPMVASVARLFF